MNRTVSQAAKSGELESLHGNVGSFSLNEIQSTLDQTTPTYSLAEAYNIYKPIISVDLRRYAVTKGSAFKRFFVDRIARTGIPNEHIGGYEFYIGDLRIQYGRSGLGSEELTIKRLTILSAVIGLVDGDGLEPSMWKNIDPRIKRDLPLLGRIFVPGLAFLYKAILDNTGRADSDFAKYADYLPSIVCGCAIMDWLAAIGSRDANSLLKTYTFEQYVRSPENHVKGEFSALLNNNKAKTLEELGLNDTGILFVKSVFRKMYMPSASKSSARSASQIMQAILEYKVETRAETVKTNEVKKDKDTKP